MRLSRTALRKSHSARPGTGPEIPAQYTPVAVPATTTSAKPGRWSQPSALSLRRQPRVQDFGKIESDDQARQACLPFGGRVFLDREKALAVWARRRIRAAPSRLERTRPRNTRVRLRGTGRPGLSVCTDDLQRLHRGQKPVAVAGEPRRPAAPDARRVPVSGRNQHAPGRQTSGKRRMSISSATDSPSACSVTIDARRSATIMATCDRSRSAPRDRRDSAGRASDIAVVTSARQSSLEAFASPVRRSWMVRRAQLDVHEPSHARRVMPSCADRDHRWETDRRRDRLAIRLSSVASGDDASDDHDARSRRSTFSRPNTCAMCGSIQRRPGLRPRVESGPVVRHRPPVVGQHA